MLDGGKTAGRLELKTSKRPSGPSPLYPRRSTLSGRPNAFPLHNVRHVLVQPGCVKDASRSKRNSFLIEGRSIKTARRLSHDRQAPRQTSAAFRRAAWWSQTGSNRRPHACKARALPTELWPLLAIGRSSSRQLGVASLLARAALLRRKTSRQLGVASLLARAALLPPNANGQPRAPSAQSAASANARRA
jgi:hypothetical protein